MAELIGSEEPRVYTPPLRELTPETSAGYSVISFAEDILGVRLFPWQRWFFIHALELTEDGGYRFRTVVLLVARQNGKSTVAKMLALWSMFVVGAPLVLGTAQDLDTSEETWAGAVELAEDCPDLVPLIDRVVKVNGKKELRLTSGERYKVAAATRRAGRGKTSDLVILDELREHMNWEAWAAVTKTTNARPQALTFGLSNAGDAYSVVLRHLRYLAHRALGDPDGWCASCGDLGGEGDDPEDDTLALFEWSAPPEASKWDREGWRLANPSLGHGTITERVLASDAARDPEPKFRTEDLCQWVETIRAQPFPEGAWEAGVDPASEVAPDSQLFFGLDVAANRGSSSIAVCGMRADGDWHVELVARRGGTMWVRDWLAARAERYQRDHGGIVIAYQKRGAPVSSIAGEIEGVGGISVREVEGRDLSAWCGRFWDSVSSCLPDSDSDSVPVRHRPQPVLDMAARTAATKPLGDSAWVFDRTRSPDDCAPLMACALAFGLATAPVETEKTVTSTYEEDWGVAFI